MTRSLMPSAPDDPAAAAARTPITALGDWFATETQLGSHRLIVMVSTASLLPIVVPMEAPAALARRLPTIVGRRLGRLGVGVREARAEVAAMGAVAVGPTNDRSTVGVLMHLVRELPAYLPDAGWDTTTLPWIEQLLADTPRFRSSRIHETVLPSDAARLLVGRRWH